MSLPAFRPRSAPEIVDAAVQLARRHYGPLGTLAALTAIPSLLIGLVSVSLVPSAVLGADQTVPMTSAEALLFLPLLLVAFSWMFIAFGAMIASAGAAYVDGRALEPLEALRRALRRAWPLAAGNLVAALLVFLITMGAFIVLAMLIGVVAALTGLGSGVAPTPGAPSALLAFALGTAAFVAVVVASLLLWSRYVNITAAVMLEERGPLAAKRRSIELVRGAMPRTAGVVLIAGVLYFVGYLTLWGLVALLVRDAQLSSTIAGVLVVALYPFIGSLLTVLYYDLRIRREGYDLELMTRALERQPAADGVTA